MVWRCCFTYYIPQFAIFFTNKKIWFYGSINFVYFAGMPIIQIATPFNIDIEFEIAEFHKRLLAYAIDIGVMLVYLLCMSSLLNALIADYESGLGFMIVTLLFPTITYTFLTELLMNGQTIGKLILKIKVVSLDGGEATLGQCLLRWFLRFYEWGSIIIGIMSYKLAPEAVSLAAGVTLLTMGGITSVIIIAVNSKSQRLGDIAAGTVVVNTKTKLSVEDTIFMDVRATDYKVIFPEVMRLSDRDINTINNVMTQANKSGNYDMCNRVAMKVRDVLKIQTDMTPDMFLEKLMEDYNYLATRE
jgi:uncharacterized RDD family membrane protein YckC